MDIYVERAKEALKVAEAGDCKVGRNEIDRIETLERLRRIAEVYKDSKTK